MMKRDFTRKTTKRGKLEGKWVKVFLDVVFISLKLFADCTETINHVMGHT